MRISATKLRTTVLGRRQATGNPATARQRLLAAALPICLLLLLGCSQLGTPDGWSGGTLVGEVLYIGTEEGQLVALDKRTGERLWLFDLEGKERDRAIYGSPALSGDTLYVSGYDGLLYVFDVGKSKDPLAWNDPVTLLFNPALKVQAGKKVRFECTHTNDDKDFTLHFGLTAENDEMCILLGYYY